MNEKGRERKRKERKVGGKRERERERENECVFLRGRGSTAGPIISIKFMGMCKCLSVCAR